MTAVHADQIVASYLKRLEAELAGAQQIWAS
jgi:hypothetical protein